MALCTSVIPAPKVSRASANPACVLDDMIEAARKTLYQRGELDERDLKQAGFTAAEIAEHGETALARLRRERRGLDA